MITHAFVPPPGLGDFCQHQHIWDGGVFVCSHKRADHEGESRLGDGPVRSTIERQQERIRKLEAEVVALRAQRDVLTASELDLNQRLRNLDILVREVSTRVEKMMLGLDNM